MYNTCQSSTCVLVYLHVLSELVRLCLVAHIYFFQLDHARRACDCTSDCSRARRYRQGLWGVCWAGECCTCAYHFFPCWHRKWLANLHTCWWSIVGWGAHSWVLIYCEISNVLISHWYTCITCTCMYEGIGSVCYHVSGCGNTRSHGWGPVNSVNTYVKTSKNQPANTVQAVTR